MKMTCIGLECFSITALCYQHVSLRVEHLIFNKLGGKIFVLVHSHLSFTHHDAGFKRVPIHILLEYLLLKFLDHGDVCRLKVPDAQLKYFQLSSELSQEATFLFTEKRVIGIAWIVGIGREHCFEKVNQAHSRMRKRISRLLVNLINFDC